MIPKTPSGPAVRKVLVATDRSATANQAVSWAATLAAAHEAELVLLQVLVDQPVDDARLAAVRGDLLRFAEEIAGSRGRARVAVDEDPAHAILDAIEADDVDVVVVGNVGMSGRKQFL